MSRIFFIARLIPWGHGVLGLIVVTSTNEKDGLIPSFFMVKGGR